MRTTPTSQELRRKYTALTEERRTTEQRVERAEDLLHDLQRRFPDDKTRLGQARADISWLKEHFRNLAEQADLVWAEWAKEADFKQE